MSNQKKAKETKNQQQLNASKKQATLGQSKKNENAQNQTLNLKNSNKTNVVANNNAQNIATKLSQSTSKQNIGKNHKGGKAGNFPAQYLYIVLFAVFLCLGVAGFVYWQNTTENADLLCKVQDTAADLKSEVEKIMNSTQEKFKEWNSEVVTDILSSFDLKFSFPEFQFGAGEDRPGKQDKTLKKKYPIVLFPGFITSQLELWHSEECAESFFSHSIWGSLSMVELILRKPSCWIKHMSLDLNTGMDPPDIKLRAVQSTHGISHLFPGFWVFGKLIQNLADIGYDSTSMYCSNFDWRLAPNLLEERDGFYSKLKKNIESLRETEGEKVVLICHSLGCSYYLYFMQWVSARDPIWVHTNMHAFINAGGALLGAHKSMPALVSGEMKDSADLEIGRAYFADAVISPLDRLSMIRSWSSVGNLLPKGNNILWGDHEHSPDNSSSFLSFTNGTGLTQEESFKFLKERLESGEKDHSAVWRRIMDTYSFEFKTPKNGFNSPLTSRDWTSPLTSPLPYAPKMKIYCLYGVGKPTERAFYYHDWESTDVNETERPHRPLSGIRYSIATNKGVGGIHLSDGDGTVPLASLGYMCVDAWKKKFYNPSLSPVITREYAHNPESIISSFTKGAGIPRGGTTTADHVDILGNHEYLADILKIVSGSEDVDDDRIISQIKEISEKITERANKQ